MFLMQRSFFRPSTRRDYKNSTNHFVENCIVSVAPNVFSKQSRVASHRPNIFIKGRTVSEHILFQTVLLWKNPHSSSNY